MFNKTKLVIIFSALCLTGFAFEDAELNEKLDRLLDNQKVILTRLQKLEKNQNELSKKVNAGGGAANKKNNRRIKTGRKRNRSPHPGTMQKRKCVGGMLWVAKIPLKKSFHKHSSQCLDAKNFVKLVQSQKEMFYYSVHLELARHS